MSSSKFIKGGVSLNNSHQTYQPINLANIQTYINNAIDIYILLRYNEYGGRLIHSYSNVGKIAYAITLGNNTYIMCKDTDKSANVIGYKMYYSKCLYVLKKSGGKNKKQKSKKQKTKKQKSKKQKSKKQKK